MKNAIKMFRLKRVMKKEPPQLEKQLLTIYTSSLNVKNVAKEFIQYQLAGETKLKSITHTERSKYDLDNSKNSAM